MTIQNLLNQTILSKQRITALIIWLCIILIIIYVTYKIFGIPVAESIIKNLLKNNNIDIEINGNRYWDMQVYNKQFYLQVQKAFTKVTIKALRNFSYA